MEARLRKLRRQYAADPTNENWQALVSAEVRTGLIPVANAPDLDPASIDLEDYNIIYRLYIDNTAIRHLIANWNRNEHHIKIDHDLWHYPLEENAVIVWPGYRYQEHLFEQLLDSYGIRWERLLPKPYPPEGYDYLHPPPRFFPTLRYNPRRIRKMVKPKKHAARRKITKIFGDPSEPRSQYTEEELIRLKEEYFYNKGQHLLFPEFPTGCRECGGDDFHREWCSLLSQQSKYRRNADIQLRDLERKLSMDSSFLPQYLGAAIRTSGYPQADNTLTDYLGSSENYYRLPPHLRNLLTQIFELGFMPGIYFEVGVEHVHPNPEDLEDFVEDLVEQLYYQYNETRRTLFQNCDKIDDDPVGPFRYAEALNEEGIPEYQANQQRWLERLAIDRNWLKTSMLRFSKVDRVKKQTKTRPAKTFYRIFIPAWALICIYGIAISTSEGFSRSNRWEHCHTTWHTKNIRRELNQSIDWPSGRPRKFTLNGLLEWHTTPDFWDFLRQA